MQCPPNGCFLQAYEELHGKLETALEEKESVRAQLERLRTLNAHILSSALKQGCQIVLPSSYVSDSPST